MLKKFIATTLFLSASTAFAGGLDLSEFSTASSVGSAGVANQTHDRDASTSALNLAAMTNLEGDHITGGLSLMDAGFEFKDDGNSVPGGSDTSNAGGQFGVPFMGYVHSLNEDVKFGLTLNSHFGLGLDYPTGWAGRYQIQEISLQSINLTPSLAFKINDKWSVGFGIVFDYATVDIEMKVNTLGPGDGTLEVEDEDLAVGSIVSLMYEPDDKTRFGLTYRSKIEHDFDDTIKASNFVPSFSPQVDVEINTPQQVLFGVRHQLNEDLAILGSANWQEWSDFGEMPTDINGNRLGVDKELDDTWGAGIAFEYNLNSDWLLMCGYHYDSAMMDTSNRTADLPTGNIHRYGIGTEYKYSEKMTIGFAFEHVDLGSPNISQTNGINSGNTLSGDYDNYINFYTVSVNYKL
ncbi:OmpP1/FadL family transporter [Lentisphaera marina]|uniref:OmpP1/FadL family transporter n=1 Tax=Lentisphaera marina TaxID=1111041 RepID=UPI0023669597|nr:OmpP1/FadL family transporter [Lentisphaera marina]MDD7983814.1 OmpP1/FadL family transporter [Lentisphaera marina]